MYRRIIRILSTPSIAGAIVNVVLAVSGILLVGIGFNNWYLAIGLFCFSAYSRKDAN